MKVTKVFDEHKEYFVPRRSQLGQRFFITPVLCSGSTYYCRVVGLQDTGATEVYYEGAATCIEGTLAFTKEQLELGQRSPSAWEPPLGT